MGKHCGIGLLSIYCLANNCKKAILTDIQDPQLYEIVEKNIALNKDLLNYTQLEKIQKNWYLTGIDWLDLVQEPSKYKLLLDQSDIIFMSDLFYDESFYEILFTIISEFFQKKTIFISYQERGNTDLLYCYADKFQIQLDLVAHTQNTKHINFESTKEIFVFQINL
ncbi:hypothetical protein ABPG74_011345 [Tetrahymena malaccensis]